MSDPNCSSSLLSNSSLQSSTRLVDEGQGNSRSSIPTALLKYQSRCCNGIQSVSYCNTFGTNLTNAINLTCPTCYSTGAGPGPGPTDPSSTGLGSNPVLQPGNNINITPLVNPNKQSDTEIDPNTIKSNPPPPPPPSNNPYGLIIGIIVGVLLIGGGCYYFFVVKKSTPVVTKGGHFDYGE
jgi:hypothetical protein